MAERKYSLKDLCAHFGVTEYEIAQMILRGELEPELPRANPSKKRYWTQSQVRRAEQKLYEKSLPPAPPTGKSTFKFSKKREARIRANALLQMQP